MVKGRYSKTSETSPSETSPGEISQDQRVSNSGLQLDPEGRLRHLLCIDGLSRELLLRILDYAESFRGVEQRPVKKAPLLRGKTVVHLFFEPSTRTRTTFELAAKRLAADVIHLDVGRSATCKGESLADTLRTLEAMHCDMFVIRHPHSGAAHFLASHAAPHVSVINAGDGCHAHPTQALLDLFTIRRHRPDFQKLCVAFIGDILHSRVARSEIRALQLLGTREIRVIGPRTLIPAALESDWGVRVLHDLREGLRDCDVVISLRLQRERMQGHYLPSLEEYYHRYGLTAQSLAWAHPDSLVMHPGPVNLGIELDAAVAGGARSLILEQVSNGIAVRMAVMALTLGRAGAQRRKA